MKIGLCVEEFFTNQTENNIENIAKAASAAKKKVDILCFGEAVLQGFFALNGDYSRDIKIAVSQDSPQINALKGIAKASRLALAFGYLELKGDDIYSSYMIIDKTGEVLYNYNRVSPGWKERNWGKEYKEGKDFGLFKFCGKDIAVGLCGDFWFDESRLNKAEIKSDIILWPVFIGDEYIDKTDWWAKESTINEYASQAAKIGKNVLLVNSLLREELAMGRAIYFENGKIKQELEIDVSGILICELA